MNTNTSGSDELEEIYRESFDEDWIYDGENERYTSSFDWKTAKPKLLAWRDKAVAEARINELAMLREAELWCAEDEYQVESRLKDLRAQLEKGGER